MATYRALNDIDLGGNNPYISAGTTFLAPPTYIPSGDVDPIDTVAIQTFWNAGPQFSTRQPFQRLTAAPVIYWTPVPGLPLTWILTGAGASLGNRQMIPIGAIIPVPPPPAGIDSQPLGMP